MRRGVLFNQCPNCDPYLEYLGKEDAIIRGQICVVLCCVLYGLAYRMEQPARVVALEIEAASEPSQQHDYLPAFWPLSIVLQNMVKW